VCIDGSKAPKSEEIGEKFEDTKGVIRTTSDNKSVSHWIMFDWFFSCLKNKIKILFNYVPHLFLLTCVKLKFFRQNNYTEKAKNLYFLNLVYFLIWLAYDKIMCFIDL
jgi:hypothetical protein